MFSVTFFIHFKWHQSSFPITFIHFCFRISAFAKTTFFCGICCRIQDDNSRALTSLHEGKCKEYPQKTWVKYHFYSSVSLNILVGTTSEKQGPTIHWRMMKFSLAKAHQFPFSLHQRRWSVLFLWSVFDPHLSSSLTIHPPGVNKACPSNKCSRCLSGPSVRLFRREDSRRGAGTQWEQRREERSEEGKPRVEHVVSPALEVSGSPQHSVPYLQKALFRDSPNEHSCPHSTWQWSPPLPLSPLTMEDIAPIKPQRQ